MAGPRKLKVFKKLSENQLQLSNTYTGLSGVNTITTGVGIGSTTITTSTCFQLVGRKNIKDTIEANVAIQSPGTFHASDGASQTHNVPSNPGHRSGGHGGASSGSNFVYASLRNFGDNSWCVASVSAACTSGIFCQFGSSDNFLIANQGMKGTGGNPAFKNDHGESSHSHNGNPGVAAGSSSLLCTYGNGNLWGSICCYQGCPGSGCPNTHNAGGRSGFVCSPFCGGIPVECFCCGVGGSRFCCENPASDCGRGWIHINTTGRRNNIL